MRAGLKTKRTVRTAWDLSPRGLQESIPVAAPGQLTAANGKDLRAQMEPRLKLELPMDG